MGYFSNGTEGMMYEDQWCSNCIHQDGQDGKSGCYVWLAHSLHNYEECNKEDSILHLLIPRTKNGFGNEKCKMFMRGKSKGEEVQADEQLRLKYEEHMKQQKAVSLEQQINNEEKQDE